jgi:hypothetical protein
MGKAISARISRQKKMKRDRRLRSARGWLPTVAGKNLVRAYKKRFGVDELCALLELVALGQFISPERIERAHFSAERRRFANSGLKKSREHAFDPHSDSDEHHYFVAGHTAAGFAFGITWEEAEASGYLENQEKNERPCAPADLAPSIDESYVSRRNYRPIGRDASCVKAIYDKI